MKKLFCLLTCLTAVSSQAAPEPPLPPFTGIYLSGAVGVTSARFNVTPNYFAPMIDTSFPGEYALHNSNITLQVALSYLYQLDDLFVIGITATGSSTNAQATHQSTFIETVIQPSGNINVSADSHINTKFNDDLSLLFKPGILAGKNTLFYALIGPRWGQFDTKLDTNFLITDSVFSEIAEDSDETSGYELGLAAGLGIQQMLGTGFHLSLEYLYTTYGEIDSPSTTPEITVAGFGTDSYINDAPKIKASTNSVLLALSYQW